MWMRRAPSPNSACRAKRRGAARREPCPRSTASIIRHWSCAPDGTPSAPRPLDKEDWLGPGMRTDLAIRVPAAGTEVPVRNGPLRLATLKAVASSEAAGAWPPALPANPVPEPDLARAETLQIGRAHV